VSNSNETFVRLLNVGCGRCYHSDWTNIDLVAHGPEVRQYDLRKGLPYDDHTFDAVYHSHVLEHLTPDDARGMLTECKRVLRGGGVLRVVVPDLEGIARAYLNSLDAVREHDQHSIANHNWMTLELIDQLSRQRSGGQMGLLMREPELINRDFVQSRIGGEMGEHKNGRVKKTLMQKLTRIATGARKQLALAAVSLVDGAAGRAAYQEGRFRQSGEIHRWMYDRFSLARLLEEVGYAQATVQTASESFITGFDAYQLDRDQTRLRKPDSLFMEAIKPRTVAVSQTPVSKVA
jgi:predicted SAM-dependent methyltransferase